MKPLKLLLAAFLLITFFPTLASDTTATNQRKGKQRIVTVSASLQHITDIDFVKREYKMELWLKFEVPKEDACALTDLERQITIKEAKIIEIDSIPNWYSSIAKCGSTYTPKLDTITKTIRIRCTMIQKWNLSGYPFDKQHLDITIYNPQRAERWLILHPKENLLHYYDHAAMENDTTSVEIENGWSFQKDSARVDSLITLLEDPFKDTYYDNDTIKHYSAIHYVIPLNRTNKWFLFIKLLVGMYVAFFVAFIALFIGMDNAEVRFSLPVGGLFAAIANKYIIESILPQSPEFSLVDWLHSLTIIFILLIIGYSAWRLYKVKKMPVELIGHHFKADKQAALLFVTAYFLINMILIASSHFYLYIQVGKLPY